MSIEEDWTSRVIHDTLQGLTLTQIFNCTIAEAWAGNDGTNYLPRPGDMWLDGPVNLPLVCSDITINYLTNTDARVTCTFSSEIETDTRVRANQVDAWEEEISVQLDQEAAKSYYDYNAAATKDWEAVWIDGGGTKETLPELTTFKPKVVYTTSLYGSDINVLRIVNSVGKINTSNLVPWFAEKQEAYEDIKNRLRKGGQKIWYALVEARKQYEAGVLTTDDSRKWLLADCRMKRVRANTLRYDFVFAYNKDEWNRVLGPSSYTTTNQYETFIPSALFAGMDKTEVEGEWLQS